MNEYYVSLIAIILGAAYAAAYAACRIVSTAVNKRAFTFIIDGAYVCITAVSAFAVNLYYCGGELRFYYAVIIIGVILAVWRVLKSRNSLVILKGAEICRKIFKRLNNGRHTIPREPVKRLHAARVTRRRIKRKIK